MATIASINFQPVKPNSTSHNERSAKLDYVSPHLTKNNESWKSDEITTRYASIVDLTKELTTRKIQAKATPIREAVVNLRHDHTMDDLKNLRDVLKKSYGIDAFQIHIHRDEGFGGKKDNFIGPLKLNLHAHMVFDWQDKKTGKSFKLNRIDMSKIQTLVAKTLGMDEGKSINNSNVVRLEATEYKRVQEEKRVHKLQEQVALLEQKKMSLTHVVKKQEQNFTQIQSQQEILSPKLKILKENLSVELVISGKTKGKLKESQEKIVNYKQYTKDISNDFKQDILKVKKPSTKTISKTLIDLINSPKKKLKPQLEALVGKYQSLRERLNSLNSTLKMLQGFSLKKKESTQQVKDPLSPSLRKLKENKVNKSKGRNNGVSF